MLYSINITAENIDTNITMETKYLTYLSDTDDL